MVWVLMLVRLLGLRSFSKMTAFDFVMTPTGFLLAGAAQASDWKGLGQAVVGITGLFLFQYLAAVARRRSHMAELVLQNEPVFLMKDGEFIEAALKSTRVKSSDVYAKLREANALIWRTYMSSFSRRPGIFLSSMAAYRRMIRSSWTSASLYFCYSR